MRWRTVRGALAVALTVAGPAAAAEPGLAAALDARIREARRVAGDVGVHVVEVASGEVVASHGADRLLVPASNQKLLTTAAALDRLGPGHRFETPLLVRGFVHRGIMVGDLAVVAGGDPNLSGRHFDGDDEGLFRGWAAALRAKGVRRVVGDLFLASGPFGGPAVHPDWPEDQLHRCYESPVTGLAYNDNCLLLRLWPAPTAGASPFVETVPADYYGAIDNRAISGRRGGRLAVTLQPEGDVLSIHGALPGGPVDTYVAVGDPQRFFAESLRGAFARHGVTIDGVDRSVGELPSDRWRTVAVHRSDLLTAVEITNKLSHNFSAEMLLKSLGAVRCGDGSWSGGTRALAEFVTERLGWGEGDFHIADGSGMSRENRVTARRITELLRFMSAHRYGVEFMRSLPAGGEPGASLEKRFDEPPFADNVFAKTGTLNFVSSLSGYAKGASGTLYAFSILLNRTSVWSGRRAQDRIVETLVERG